MAMETQKPSMDTAHVQSPMKFSRYRSVRRAASQKPKSLNTSVPPVPSPPSAPVTSTASHNGTGSTNDPPSASISRSMSRYRRQRAPTATPATAQSPAPALPAHGAQLNGVYPQSIPETPADATKMAQVPAPSRRVPDAATTAKVHGDGNAPAEDDEAEREKHRQDAMARLTGESNKPRLRRATTQERAVPRVADDRRKHDASDPLARCRKSDDSSEPKRRSLKERMKLVIPRDKSAESAAKAVEPAAGSYFTGVDAPVSAVNAGERNVLVQYGKMSAKLSVMPSTRVQDLLFMASRSLTSEIDPLNFILMESFSQLGLERPLRRYECIRDVMNSWAHDGENALIIVHPASLESLRSLEAQNVPVAPPADVTVHAYYSQRPRKWDKRFVTLRSDGQITVSKKEHGQDQTNACHISDFDIYALTLDSLRNNVKPPKKICQAIKSQQKSSMFLSTENFVHFISTNDRAVAQKWYNAVQTWRSWYLVHKKGAAPVDEAEEIEDIDNSHQQRIGSSHSRSNQPRSFKPLIDLDSDHQAGADAAPPSTAVSDEPAKSSKSKDMFIRKGSSREHGPPPSSFPKSLVAEPDMSRSAAQSSEESPFSSGGLLGRTYTVRQQIMKDREEKEKRANEEPFTSNGLVGTLGSRRGPVSQPASRSNTMTSAQPPDLNGGMNRSLSVNRGKPLVDLTPVYQAPPQHSRKGRGVAVEPGVPLIDAVNGLDPVGGIAIPPSTTWRRPPVPPEPLSIPEMQTRKRSNTARSASNHRPYHAESASPMIPLDHSQSPDNPFLANSLLARTAQLAVVPSSGPVGHGVATGDRNATKPMLDMTPASPFAEGSLLRNL
ncbi:uncharacterized protein ACLA_002990 [Aspergillus clavatus NRRL 1]|uniref:PH domain-containing protein n=1 Tax=Aspergillus clavatus (strain ATCC 1007 / CBS 513.65 / DSM 816 / NCTC 3887 / NRRL 1 / QM 1276 / 107) TaxID=344612 RepID=A1C5C0_ASPCL|nr:uncharacterized protein ACLA_002990 [Aspergillus clavatus NRRL 1]EAW14888.1 conserved hypothetical protein [Aspergillus clavatus NRRL 1]